jgi:hypothetical protein
VRVVDPLGDKVPTIEVAKMVIRAAAVIENAIEHTGGDAVDVPRPRRWHPGIGAQRSSAPLRTGAVSGRGRVWRRGVAGAAISRIVKITRDASTRYQHGRFIRRARAEGIIGRHSERATRRSLCPGARTGA